MRGYIIPEIGAHVATLFWFQGYGGIANQWVSIFSDFQAMAAGGRMRGIRIVIPQSPFRYGVNMDEDIHPAFMPLYDGVNAADVAATSKQIETYEKARRFIKAAVSYEHHVRKTPMDRIVLTGLCQGGGLSVYAAIMDAIGGIDVLGGEAGIEESAFTIYNNIEDNINNTIRTDDPYPELETASLLYNVPLPLNTIPLIGTFSSPMPGILHMVEQRKALKLDIRQVPFIYNAYGLRDVFIPPENFFKNIDAIRELLKSLGQHEKQGIYVHTYNGLDHNFWISEILDFAHSIVQLVDLTPIEGMFRT